MDSLRKRNIAFVSLSVAFGMLVFGMAAVAINYLDRTTNTEEYKRLVDRVESAATLIDPEDIAQLTGTRADVDNPTYTTLKGQLVALRAANSDLRFAYLMQERDGQVFFLADSELPTSPDYSPPGQSYPEASDELLAGFEPRAGAVLEIYTDRWGNWISALAPIVNASGTTVALVGFDQDADAHRNTFVIEVGLVALAALVLICLLGALYLMSREAQDYADLKADFVAAASHELRTPLTSIRWTLATLRSDATLPPESRTLVDTIYRRICTLIEASNAFLVAASVDHGILRASDLRDSDIASMVAASLARAHELAAEKNIRIESDLVPNTPIYMAADVDKLRLVFDNLFANAIKYSPRNSKIHFSFREEGRMKIFSVSDSGIGIPAAEIRRIFSGFARGSNAKRLGVPGTGFGLYMTRRVVEFHGGSIECTSHEGQGSVFTVRLPGVY